MNIYLVNRNVDTHRRDRFIKENIEKFSLEYIWQPAVDAYCEHFNPKEHEKLFPKRGKFSEFIPLGSFGNFLSQMRIWRKIDESGLPGLVCEDDVIFDENIVRANEFVSKCMNADIIFGNDRCCPPASFVPSLGDGSINEAVTVFPLSLSINLNLLTTKRWGAPGADCYYLSPTGARKLISLVEEIGTFMHIDWMMVKYSVAGLNSDYFYASGMYQPFLTIVNAELFSAIRLNAATLRQPVAHHRPGDVGGSVIKNVAVVKKYIDVPRCLVVEK